MSHGRGGICFTDCGIQYLTTEYAAIFWPRARVQEDGSAGDAGYRSIGVRLPFPMATPSQGFPSTDQIGLLGLLGFGRSIAQIDATSLARWRIDREQTWNTTTLGVPD